MTFSASTKTAGGALWKPDTSVSISTSATSGLRNLIFLTLRARRLPLKYEERSSAWRRSISARPRETAPRTSVSEPSSWNRAAKAFASARFHASSSASTAFRTSSSSEAATGSRRTVPGGKIAGFPSAGAGDVGGVSETAGAAPPAGGSYSDERILPSPASTMTS